MNIGSLKNVLVLVFGLAILMAFDRVREQRLEQQDTRPAKEQLYYKLKIGWFTIGSGTVTIRRNVEKANNKSYDQVEVYAETLGLGNWLGSLDDTYISIIENKTMKAIRSEKHVAVGKSTWDQWCTFDYDSMTVDVKVVDHRKEDPNRHWSVHLSDSSYGVLSTFMFLSSRSWREFAKGDSVMVKTFYEKKHYEIGVKYMGLEMLKFQGQQVPVYKLSLLLPDHENYKKERPVYVYLTADEHQYPIKVQTKLPFLGRARIELVTLNGEEPIF